MINHVKEIKEDEDYILKEGEEKFKDGVTNGFRVTLHRHLSCHGGIEGKGVIQVLMIDDSGDSDEVLPYFEGAAFQKLHQHWIDSGDVLITKL